MRAPRRFLTGTLIQVTERAGLLKAHLNGFYGWTAVWADSIENLMLRVKRVRMGGQ